MRSRARTHRCFEFHLLAHVHGLSLHLFEPNCQITCPVGFLGNERGMALRALRAPSTTREFPRRAALRICPQRRPSKARGAVEQPPAKTLYLSGYRAESGEMPLLLESTLAKKFSPAPATAATRPPNAHVQQRTLRHGSIAAPRQGLHESNQVSSPAHHPGRLYGRKFFVPSPSHK